MRFLNSSSFQLRDFGAEATPRYAILSHTWGEDEVLLADMQGRRLEAESKKGWEKIARCCMQAEQDGYKWLWIDTCCIDKTSSAELSESINSMYQWYEEATICYAFLADVFVKDVTVDAQFANSRWFTRGWTLQELIAPAKVKFLNAHWQHIGTKQGLAHSISSITGIDVKVLEGIPANTCSVARRMSWAAFRQTTRVEDKAYCLLGLFEVNMPMLYGERDRAFLRLQEQILKATEDPTLFAWREHPSDKPVGAAFSYHGILAPSPDNFCRPSCVQCITPMDWDYSELDYGPPELADQGGAAQMSMRGLRLDMPTLPGKNSGWERQQDGPSTGGELLIHLYSYIGNHKDGLCLVVGKQESLGSDLVRIGLERVPGKECRKFQNRVVHISPLSRSYALAKARERVLAIPSSVEHAGAGKLDSVQALLPLIDVDVQQKEYTALMQASIHGRTDVVRFLVESSADLEIVSNTTPNSTALTYAARGGHLDIVTLLIEKGAKTDGICAPMVAAASTGKLDVVKYLVKIRADKWCEQGPGVAAFLTACNYNQLEVVKYLVSEYNVDVESIDGEVPALHIAAAYGSVELVKFLINHGASIHSKGIYERTALHEAAIHHRIDVLMFLLDRGADSDARDASNLTAMEVIKTSRASKTARP